MTTRRHKTDTRTFDELTLAGQAKSISAQLATLTRAVRAHVRRAARDGKDPEKTRRKCLAQVNRLAERIGQ
jgi:predicted RNA-binding protein associated with RNAse of E/G family